MIKDSKNINTGKQNLCRISNTLARKIEYCYVTDIRNCECAQVINKKCIERGDYIG